MRHPAPRCSLAAHLAVSNVLPLAYDISYAVFESYESDSPRVFLAGADHA